MTIYAAGKIAGALPAPPTADYLGLVHEILFAPDPAATTVVSVTKGGTVIRSFNVPAATGPLDFPFQLKCMAEGDLLDPTQFSTTSTGLYITYIWY